MTSFALPVPLAAGSLETYIQSVNSLPLLTVERERELARRYHGAADGPDVGFQAARSQ